MQPLAEPFRFAIAIGCDDESLDLLREISSQMARAAGLDDRGARLACNDLVETIARGTGRGGAGARCTVCFERREASGRIDVHVVRWNRSAPAGEGGRPQSPLPAEAEFHRSWGAS